jgi:hypothetical protein
VNGKEAVDLGPRAVGAEEIDFDSAFRELQRAVRGSCSRSVDWQDRIAAGVLAALEFAADDPPAASALTIEGAAARSDADGARHPELVEHFSGLLDEVVPSERRLSAATARALISTVITVVVIHLRCGTTERLRETAPDLVHLTLLPYTGFAGAKRWAELDER